MRRQFRRQSEPDVAKTGSPGVGVWTTVRELLFHVEPNVGSITVYGRAVVLLVFVIWGWQFILTDYDKLSGALPEINSSFMHGINLVFHEAGHIIFVPLGRFMAILGGSLGQLLMPLIVMGAFVRNRDTFGASIGLWWFSQSLMDLAPYINDARAGQMMLLGGVTGSDRPGYHDWTNILGDLGLLQYDHSIAGSVNAIGITLMLLSCIWGAYILLRQYQQRDTRL